MACFAFGVLFFRRAVFCNVFTHAISVESKFICVIIQFMILQQKCRLVTFSAHWSDPLPLHTCVTHLSLTRRHLEVSVMINTFLW
jgi:hypothetical protein